MVVEVDNGTNAIVYGELIVSRSLLYFFIYVVTFSFVASPVDQLITINAGYALMLLVLWVGVSSAIVHIIHFWPTKIR